MRFLVLGGTAWLGRTIATDAAGRGHQVTCLARGESGEPAPEVRFVRADRDRADAYDEVTGEPWDAVIDLATQPGQVRRAAASLAEVALRYLFVSTASVYASHRQLDQDESAPLLAPLDGDVMDSMELYGEAKAACEDAVVSAFGPDRCLISRPDLIGGPGDESGRSGYWPWRFARPSNPDGDVLVPDAPDLPTALIDVRDLARWLVSCTEAATTGTFNVGANRMPLAEHLAAAHSVAGHSGRLVAAPGQWLAAHGVQNWSGPASLPLWLDDPDWHGMNARDASRARAAGLTARPLEATLADTLAWELSRPDPGPHGAGLSDDDERRLLAAFAAR